MRILRKRSLRKMTMMSRVMVVTTVMSQGLVEAHVSRTQRW